MRRISDFTVNEFNVLKHIKLIVPVCTLEQEYTILSCDVNDILLPPLYRELVADQELDALACLIQKQLIPKREGCSLQMHHDDCMRPAIMVPRAEDKAIFAVDPIEQHGPFLNIGTDATISSNVINRLVKRYPFLRPVKSLFYANLSWGLALGASISIPTALEVKMLSRYVEYLRRKGFGGAVIVSTHLARSHQAALATLKKRYPSFDLRILYPLKALDETNSDAHAGLTETAISAYLDLDVRLDLLIETHDRVRVLSKEAVIRRVRASGKNFKAYADRIGWSGIVGDLQMSGHEVCEIPRLLRWYGKNYFHSVLNHCACAIERI